VHRRYGLLNGSSEESLAFPLLAGSSCAPWDFALGGRRVRRSQYRPDLELPEWLVVAPASFRRVSCGDRVRRGSLNPRPPLSWPTLPVYPALAILVARWPVSPSAPLVRPNHGGQRKARAITDTNAGSVSPAPGPGVIELQQVTVTTPCAAAPCAGESAYEEVSWLWWVEPGGKSTLLRVINGLVPHFTGTLAGGC